MASYRVLPGPFRFASLPSTGVTRVEARAATYGFVAEQPKQIFGDRPEEDRSGGRPVSCGARGGWGVRGTGLGGGWGTSGFLFVSLKQH